MNLLDIKKLVEQEYDKRCLKSTVRYSALDKIITFLIDRYGNKVSCLFKGKDVLKKEYERIKGKQLTDAELSVFNEFFNQLSNVLETADNNEGLYYRTGKENTSEQEVIATLAQDQKQSSILDNIDESNQETEKKNFIPLIVFIVVLFLSFGIYHVVKSCNAQREKEKQERIDASLQQSMPYEEYSQKWGEAYRKGLERCMHTPVGEKASFRIKWVQDVLGNWTAEPEFD